MKLHELVNNKNFQARVHHGSEAQDLITDLLHREFKKMKVLSSAPIASKKPDLVVDADGHRLQFEIKGRANPGARIKFYERSLGRGDADKIFDTFASTYTNGKITSFSKLIDRLQKTNPVFGFPGDEGVAKSGSIWLNVDDKAVLSRMRRFLVNTLKHEGNNYFAILNRNEHNVEIYHTGNGANPLETSNIPQINQILIDTYGGQYKGKMRVALKVRLAS